MTSKNKAWRLSYKKGWWFFKKTVEVGSFRHHEDALNKITELAYDTAREFYLVLE